MRAVPAQCLRSACALPCFRAFGRARRRSLTRLFTRKLGDKGDGMAMTRMSSDASEARRCGRCRGGRYCATDEPVGRDGEPTTQEDKANPQNSGGKKREKVVRCRFRHVCRQFGDKTRGCCWRN